MAALLVGLSIMAVLMSAALPVWSHHMKREREEELIWRGQQYARAVGLFQRKYANTFPPTVDILVEQRFLRKKYKDPITNSDFQPIPAGGSVQGPPGSGSQPPGSGPAPLGGGQRQGGAPTSGFNIQTRLDNGRTNTGTAFGQVQGPSIGIQGVVSKSKDSSIKIYNGRTKYNEWAFVYLATSQRVGAPTGQQQPGVQPGGFPGGMQPGGMPGRPGGFGPQGPPAGGRPPVPFPPPGSGFQTPGQPPNAPASPFAPPPPMGRPPAGVRPPGV